MGSELLALLEQEAAAERERILAEARTQADQMRAAAVTQAAELVESQRRQQEAALQANRVRAQSTARLAAQALLLEAKDEAIAEVFRRAEEALDQVVRDHTRYGRILEHLIPEGIQGFNGRVIIEAHPDDVKAVQAAVQRQKLDAEVRAAEGVHGGVRLFSTDGRYIVLNTLQSRLERARPALASEVARTLWG
jgi:V/A-type H+-transporting ATPase subunit E